MEERGCSLGTRQGGYALAVANRLRTLYLFHLSKPASDRPLYQAIHQQPIRSVLEVGTGAGERALRMIEVAGMQTPINQVYYTGIDEFESRPLGAEPQLTLKNAYRLLRETGARVRLLPGDPNNALSQAANDLGKIDLVFVSSQVNQESMARAWFFFPRMLHTDSRVFLERRESSGSEPTVRLLTSAEVTRLAEARPFRRAA
jgi:hypothetical protein